MGGIGDVVGGEGDLSLILVVNPMGAEMYCNCLVVSKAVTK